MRWGMLFKLFLWVVLAFGGSIWLPPAPTEMDLTDPAHFPQGDDSGAHDHRQTLLKYLLVRLALWVLFALFFGGPSEFWYDPGFSSEDELFLLGLTSQVRNVSLPSPPPSVAGELFGFDTLVEAWPWGSAVVVGSVWFLLTRPKEAHLIFFGGRHRGWYRLVHQSQGLSPQGKRRSMDRGDQRPDQGDESSE